MNQIFISIKYIMDLEVIKTKLNKLKEMDKNFAVFGSNSHEYEQNPPLSEAEVAAYETANVIRLPDEYRQYLTHVANGGAGPFYGLMALDDNDKNIVDLSKRSEFARNAPVCMDDILYARAEALTADVEDEDEVEKMYDDIIGEAYTKANYGITYLAHEGCGMYSVLVVNGDEYGNVWYMDFANDAGAFPLTSPKTGEAMHFFEWFEIWLDRSMEKLNGTGKGLRTYSDFIQNAE